MPNFTSDVVIGLEVHVELDTKTKLFCGCPTKPKQGLLDAPNARVCEICLGHPGSKPVLNKKAVEFGIKLCLALNCQIAPHLIFSRKSYFYPDLAKNYQVSQYELPLGSSGKLTVDQKDISITRAHLEEDPASILHPAGMKASQYVLVDYNRSGAPLIEVVTGPDMTTPSQARDFMKQLITILTYLEIFDPNKCVIKADANVSIKESNYSRVEIKNITGFKEIETALNYEIARQKKEVQEGKQIPLETRGWDADKAHTFSMRKKESEEDYGYIIDTDLVPTHITQDMIQTCQAAMPELASDKKEKYVSKYNIDETDAKVIAGDKHIAEFFEEVAQTIDKVLAARWIRRELLRVLNYNKKTIQKVDITPTHMINLLTLISQKKITDNVAQKILEQLIEKPFDVKEHVASQGLEAVSDTGELEKFCDEAIQEAPQAVQDYIGGEEKSLNFIVGLVMKKTRGKADPQTVKDIIKGKINNTK